MINTQLEHVPLPIKEEALDEDLDGENNDSDDTEDTNESEDDASLMISSDEEAELEAQRIRIHELVRFHSWVGKNLELRERGRTRSSSRSSSSSVMMLASSSPAPDQGNSRSSSEKTVASASTNMRKRHAGEMESCGNIFIYPSEVMLIFHCSFCDLRYAEIPSFARHLHEKHRLFMESEASQRKNSRTDEKAGDDEVEIKEEILAPVEIPQQLESCGNVFVLNKQKLLLICGYCEYKYATLELFTMHLRQQHHLLKKTPPSNEKLHSPKKEVKEEDVFVIKFLSNDGERRQSAETQPMVAIPPQHITVDNNELLPTICCSSRSSMSSGMLTPPVSNSAEMPLSGEEPEVNSREEQQKEISPAKIAENLASKRGRAKGSKNDKAVKPKTNRSRVTNKPPQTDDTSTSVGKSNKTKEKCSKQSSNIKNQQKIVNNTPPPDAVDTTETQNQDNHHKKSTKPKVIYQCDVCEKTFRKNARLISHTMVHTGEKPFGCNYCGKKFRLKTRLGDHLLRHRKEKLHKCSTCGLAVATRQDLLLHQRHHNGDRRHKCDQCPKAFVRFSDLTTHKRVHTGEKPFKCEVCNKNFAANQNLIIHRKSHLNDKPYKCEICEKSFTRNIDRKIHFRTHTGEKAYKCEICGKGYSSRFHVRAHLQREHVMKGEGLPKKKPGPKPKALKEACDIPEETVKVTRATRRKPEPKPKKSTNQSIQLDEFILTDALQQQPPEKPVSGIHAQAKPPLQKETQDNASTNEKVINVPEAVVEQQLSLALSIALGEDDAHSGVINANNVGTIQMLEKENDTPEVLDVVIINSDIAVLPLKPSSKCGMTQQHQKQKKQQQTGRGGGNIKKERKITNYFAVRGQKTAT